MKEVSEIVDHMSYLDKVKHLERMITRPCLVDDNGKFTGFIEPTELEKKVSAEICSRDLNPGENTMERHRIKRRRFEITSINKTYICHKPGCGLRPKIGEWCPYHKGVTLFIEFPMLPMKPLPLNLKGLTLE